MPEKLTPEQENLRRLRERQLSARDPHEKQRKFQQFAAKRERNRNVGVSIPEMWATIPQIWRWGLGGLILAVVTAILLPRYWISEWANTIGIVLAIFILMMSFTIGKALDLRDNIKKNL